MTEKTIRVAQIMGKMENGGVEAVVMNYYRHMDKNKVQFDFIVDSDSSCPQESEILSMGGKVIRIAPYQSIIANMRDLKKVFTKNHYKIVHVHLSTMSVFALNVAKRCSVPIRICHNHSTASKGETKKNILKYTLRPFAKLYPTHLFACSEYAGMWLYGKKAMRNGKVTVLKNAIDLERFCYNPQIRQNVRKELGVEKNFVVGHIGRFVYSKNHVFLIDVFHELHRRNPNSVLILIGEGPLEQEIHEKVKSLHLEDAVRFLGARKNVERLYQGMDVFVFPSRDEGLGMVAVEAQVAGLNTVCSDNVPIEARVTDTIQFISLSEPIDKWIDLIATKNENRKVELINREFDIKKQAEKLAMLYGKLLGFDNVAKIKSNITV